MKIQNDEVPAMGAGEGPMSCVVGEGVGARGSEVFLRAAPQLSI